MAPDELFSNIGVPTPLVPESPRLWALSDDLSSVRRRGWRKHRLRHSPSRYFIAICRLSFHHPHIDDEIQCFDHAFS